MLLQVILECLGLGGFAGSCLCCGHLLVLAVGLVLLREMTKNGELKEVESRR